MDEQKNERNGQDAKHILGETEQNTFTHARCYKCGNTFELSKAYHDKLMECPHCHVQYVVGILP